MAIHVPLAGSVRIGLLWHSPNSSNYGVGALTAAHVALVKEVVRASGRDVAFEMTGWSDPMPTYVNEPRIRFLPMSRRFLFARRDGLADMARRCHLVLDIAGGDSFTDIYGARRFVFQALSKAIVLSTGTPLVLAPQTVGPFEGRLQCRIAAGIMRRCRAVVARDRISGDFVRALDPRIRLLEATDVAFGLDYERRPHSGDGKIRVGINVSGLLFAGGYRRGNDFGLKVDYPHLMRALVARFAARPGCEVTLFSHVVVPRRFENVAEDDHRVAAALAAEFPAVRLAPSYGSPQETKAHVATMDFFCGSRMHACVAAFSAGVPTVPIAYSRKFAGLFGTLGYDLVVDPRTEDEETILRTIEMAFERRSALAAEVAAANREARRRLDVYRDLVRSALPPAAATVSDVRTAAAL